MSLQYKKRLFSVDEYHQMITAGIIKEDDRVELIDGEIIAMPPIGPSHASNVDRLTSIFYFNLGNTIIVRIQSPIQLNDYSEPQPDVAILKYRSDFYKNNHPKPEDILLVVEIAETSVEYDRSFKIPRYAQSNIIETWLFDLKNKRIEMHRNPMNDIYQEIRIAQKGQQISCINFPNITFSVDDLLG
jgi:Uma2 family endonuclease